MRRLPLLALALAPAAAHAQPRPPIRPLGPVVATSSAPIGLVTSVRALPGGRVLLNDALQRRVVLLDSTLAAAAVIADTTPATGNAYGGRIGGLIPYRGDSTLFVDAQSMSMLVIDPAGKVGRTMSVPRAQDANALVSAAFGTPGFDARGRLVYRAMPQFRFAGGAPGAAPGGGARAFAPPEMPDSAPLVRVDLVSRAVDTLAFVKTPKIRMQITESGDGRMSMQSLVNPLPVVDDWAVLSDGSVAIVRGREYRVDLVGADGKLQTLPKVSFDWQRLTDEQKSAFIDSVKAQRARMGAVGGMDMAAMGPRIVMNFDGPGGPGGPPPRGGGEQRRVVEGGANTTVVGGPNGATNMPAPPPLQFVDPSELPDYRPAFLANASRADASGNVWVRTTAAPTQAGALVYDVVNAKGELVDRVQTPPGRQIMGFGPDGSVYLVAREGTGPTATTTLERARIK
ncbi:hypothetical protein [Roseisolibacter sp. H3M3-2]|uniref:hypothetical protein n=1 Tax=Roseisolibacter sp. H3M3-2 TaxID=3031323 RepID=UPI0023DC940A|nr:hypothetical protein [Roseisolibacter sp. H3M3-2]MDF1502540.1 hypothetical protein [Roseisolibacter sp. H3M3-2]